MNEVRTLLNDENIKIVRKILETTPSQTNIMLILASLFYEIGCFREAEEWYKRILEREVNVIALHNLGDICSKDGRLSQAAEYRRKVLQIHPDNGEFLYHLGLVLMEIDQTQEGIDLLQMATSKMPNRPDIHSGFLFSLHYLPNLDYQILFNEHRRWARAHAPAGLAKTSHDNVPEPDRRLRIGYISPDFYGHPVMLFFESLLDGHNRQELDIYGYGNVKQPDQFTERFKTKFNHYRNIYGVEDKTVVDMIEADKIDILVDLAGHSGDNRLPVLAHKPAPIQATCLGYFETTGMQQIDYHLTDELANPPQSQQFYTEEFVYLPNGFLCYRPPDYAPAVTALPADNNGYITFGMFGNSCKINPFVMALWAKVLEANEGSRLLLIFKGGGDRQLKEHYLEQFEQFRIHRDRLDIRDRKRALEYFRQYAEVDIILDTYPYNGGTTTCDALWMGVPVISLTGKHHMSRIGLSILTHLGMDFLIASTPEEYIAKSTVVAGNRQALAKIRASIRKRMANSVLCDTKGFAGSVEAAYRKIWQRWCEAGPEGRKPSLRDSTAKQRCSNKLS
jgi:predicted O-linked N-acetylglucosamine transferase (SPINDLY family)